MDNNFICCTGVLFFWANANLSGYFNELKEEE